MSHYEIEDTPPQDVETQLAMYEESRKVVSEAGEKASRLLSEAEPLLKELFSAATGDAELQAAVNGAWERTQQMAVIVSQQGAALNGASAAVESLKVARDGALNELNIIIQAMKDHEYDVHPQLESFREQIEDMLVEENYYAMDFDEFDIDTMVDHVFENVEPLLSGVGFIYRREVVEKFVNMLLGEDAWTDEQEAHFRAIFESMSPLSSLQSIHLADDYEEDEADSHE